MTTVPGLRGLRALVSVASQGSVSSAGEELNLSQSAVSRAIQDVEQQLGVEVFERHYAGMVCTDLGRRVVHRCRRALEQFRRAEETLGQLQPVGRFDRLVQRINERQLAVMKAIYEHHTERAAAHQLGLRQPTISATLRALEDRLNTPLFLRTRRGMVITLCGMTLLRHYKVMQRELTLMQDDIAHWRGQTSGRVVIGALPLTSAYLVPKVIDAVLKEFPGLNITVHEGSYDTLVDMLHNADVDFLVGVLHPNRDEPDLVQTLLFYDRLFAFARPGHPLALREAVTLKDLLDWPWIAPPKGTPARLSFNQQFTTPGLTPPTPHIEVGHLSVIRALLLSSDRIALMSPYQAHYETLEGRLVRLPVILDGPPRPIGYSYRDDSTPTPGFQAMMQALDRLAQ
ncbi:LysR substrate-binding domain-containing protein [Saccharospirillum sp.]|uniref:LysR substrate-binding domain-containing protein n=1 Tax=Saccharospirillum sp. TaxID=2033801 RepID=UPI00349FD376